MKHFHPFYLLLSLIAGIFIALQSRINGGLGLALEDGVSAALYSFTSGTLVLGVIVLSMPSARKGILQLGKKLYSGELPAWMILGGGFGGFLVMTQGLAAGSLGISLFTVAVVAGQGISAILIDTNGLFGVEKRKLNPARLLGAITVLVGVALVVGEPQSKTGLLVLLPLSAGLGLGFQQAANGMVRISSGSAIAATFMNFAVGTLTILIVKVLTIPVTGVPQTYPSDIWLYAGGAVGVMFIAIQVVAVSRIGVLSLGVMLGTGQLVGSVLIDLVFPVAERELNLLTVYGVLLALIGALVVNVRRGS
ncbi:MAG: DMT family transporter [Aquiluna sp.]|nr:DMT family transporter [Aquiluna sp.]MCF8545977.1 DMT family transporter [Aquiluna sp.]